MHPTKTTCPIEESACGICAEYGYHFLEHQPHAKDMAYVPGAGPNYEILVIRDITEIPKYISLKLTSLHFLDRINCNTPTAPPRYTLNVSSMYRSDPVINLPEGEEEYDPSRPNYSEYPDNIQPCQQYSCTMGEANPYSWFHWSLNYPCGPRPFLAEETADAYMAIPSIPIFSVIDPIGYADVPWPSDSVLNGQIYFVNGVVQVESFYMIERVMSENGTPRYRHTWYITHHDLPGIPTQHRHQHLAIYWYTDSIETSSHSTKVLFHLLPLGIQDDVEDFERVRFVATVDMVVGEGMDATIFDDTYPSEVVLEVDKVCNDVGDASHVDADIIGQTITAQHEGGGVYLLPFENGYTTIGSTKFQTKNYRKLYLAHLQQSRPNFTLQPDDPPGYGYIGWTRLGVPLIFEFNVYGEWHLSRWEYPYPGPNPWNPYPNPQQPWIPANPPIPPGYTGMVFGGERAIKRYMGTEIHLPSLEWPVLYPNLNGRTVHWLHTSEIHPFNPLKTSFTHIRLIQTTL